MIVTLHTTNDLNDLMTIITPCCVTDMKPVWLKPTTTYSGFIDELIKISVGNDELRKLMGNLRIGDIDVGSFTIKVLGVLHSPYPLVQLLRPVTTGNDYPTETAAKRFQHCAAQ